MSQATPEKLPVEFKAFSERGCCERHRWKIITAVALLAIALAVTGGLLYHFGILNILYSSCLMGGGGLLGLTSCISAVVLVCRSSSRESITEGKPSNTKSLASQPVNVSISNDPTVNGGEAQPNPEGLTSQQSRLKAQPMPLQEIKKELIDKYLSLNPTISVCDQAFWNEQIAALSLDIYKQHAVTIEQHCIHATREFNNPDRRDLIKAFWLDPRAKDLSFENIYRESKQRTKAFCIQTIQLMGQEAYEQFLVCLQQDLAGASAHQLINIICEDQKFFESPAAIAYISEVYFGTKISDGPTLILDLFQKMSDSKFKKEISEKNLGQVLNSIFEGFTCHKDETYFQECLAKAYTFFAGLSADNKKSLILMLSGSFFGIFANHVVKEYTNEKISPWEPDDEALDIINMILNHPDFTPVSSQSLGDTFDRLVLVGTHLMDKLLIHMSPNILKSVVDYILKQYKAFISNPEQLPSYTAMLRLVANLFMTKKIEASPSETRFIEFVDCIIYAYTNRELMPWWYVRDDENEDPERPVSEEGLLIGHVGVTNSVQRLWEPTAEQNQVLKWIVSQLEPVAHDVVFKALISHLIIMDSASMVALLSSMDQALREVAVDHILAQYRLFSGDAVKCLPWTAMLNVVFKLIQSQGITPKDEKGKERYLLFARCIAYGYTQGARPFCEILKTLHGVLKAHQMVPDVTVTNAFKRLGLEILT